MNSQSPSPSPAINPYIALVVGVCAVSTGAIFARLADAPALVIAAYRVSLAVVVLTPVALWRVRGEILALSRREVGLALLSGFFLALHFATWISSLDYTAITNSVVLVNTNPLWVAIFTPFVTGERITRMAALGVVVSVLGGVAIGAGDLALGGQALYGDALALVGGVCAAAYLLLGRNLRKQLSLLAYIQLCYGCAAVLLWIMVLAAGLPVTGFSTGTMAAFWAMAFIPQLIGHTSYNWSLRWFSPSLVAVSLLGEPIGATILGFIIFNEGLTAEKLIGGALICAGIYLAARAERPMALDGARGGSRGGTARGGTT